MPVDASIPLQVQGPQTITLNSIADMMQMKQQIAQQRQQQAVQNSLAQIYANPSSLGPDGLPNNDAVRQISAISPQMGIQLQTQKAKIDADKALSQERAASVYKTKAETIHNDLLDPAIVAYDQARNGGLSEQQARAKGQQAYNDNLTTLKQSGLFSDQEIAQMPSSFDPDRVRAGAIKYKDYLGIQEKQKSDDRADARLQSQIQHQNTMESLAERREGRIEANLSKAQASGDEKLDKDTLEVMADQYMAGDTSVFTNLGRGKQGAENVIALRKEIASRIKEGGGTGADQAAQNAAYGGIKAAQRAAGTKLATTELAVNEADQMADLALEASKNVPRGKFVPINKAINAYNSNTGDPETRKFGAAVNSFVNAYARAISPTGTPTVSDKEHARDLLSTADGDEAFNAVIGQMKQEMQAAKKSPGFVRDELREAVTKKPAQSSGDRPRAVNPKTGHTVVWNGSAWVDE